MVGMVPTFILRVTFDSIEIGDFAILDGDVEISSHYNLR